VDVILDTDHLSVLQRETQPAYDRLRSRMKAHDSGVTYATIVSFQEQTRGWLVFINKAKKPSDILYGYAELHRLLLDYAAARILLFDASAQAHFVTLRKSHVNIGTMDLRIASIALATDCILLSSNKRDFEKVPSLRLDDWTV
jgi:tRNA(fMet)-specific endonuclease VapC